VKRKALGRGLSALIPETRGGGAGGEFFVCPIEKIRPSKDQPRKYFDAQKLEELVASIREQGVVQPLVVRPARGGNYTLVVGERRWRAAQKAGIHDVPVVIRAVDELEAFELALVENLHRADLNPIEEAEAYQRLLKEHGYTQERLASRLGRDRSTVTNTLRLLRLPAAVQRSLRSGAISPGHARALLPLEKASIIDKVHRQVISKQLSVRQTELLVKRLLKPTAAQKTSSSNSPNVRDLQRRLSHSLKTRVRLTTTSKNKGRIEIAYSSLDELDRLLEVLLK
jgi:ParB family chromosome partitioning protein